MTKWSNESKGGEGRGEDIYLILKNRSNIDHINICPFHEARFLTCGSVIEDMLFFARFFPAVSFPRFVTYPISRSAIDEAGGNGRAR